jgi:hypothetical protein
VEKEKNKKNENDLAFPLFQCDHIGQAKATLKNGKKAFLAKSTAPPVRPYLYAYTPSIFIP